MTELLSSSALSSQGRALVVGPQARLAAVRAGSFQPNPASAKCCSGACRGCLPPGRRSLVAEIGSGPRKRNRVDRPRIAVGLSPIAELLRCIHLPKNDEQPEIVLSIISSLIEASACSGFASIGQSSPSIQSFGDPRMGNICWYFIGILWK